MQFEISIPKSVQSWGGKPYFPISQVYREKFGQKVVKIPVSLAEDCPNRRGLRGMKTCIFCDVHGSFAYPESQQESLLKQIELHRVKVAERSHAVRFLIYFQAYTSTFLQLGRLRSAFDLAINEADVAGIVVGTRPDCLSAAVLDLWKEYAKKTFLSVEIGVQSFNDKHLEFMRRGHTSLQSIEGIKKIKDQAEVDVGLHLIFGWPDETEDDIKQAAENCNRLPISNVKLHNLHVLKNTPLADLWTQGEFRPLSLDEYADRVSLFLDHLSPAIAVHRLAALSSRWEELLAPEWTRHKMKSFQGIIDRMHEQGSYQGRCFKLPSELL